MPGHRRAAWPGFSGAPQSLHDGVEKCAHTRNSCASHRAAASARVGSTSVVTARGHDAQHHLATRSSASPQREPPFCTSMMIVIVTPASANCCAAQQPAHNTAAARPEVFHGSTPNSENENPKHPPINVRSAGRGCGHRRAHVRLQHDNRADGALVAIMQPEAQRAKPTVLRQRVFAGMTMSRWAPRKERLLRISHAASGQATVATTFLLPSGHRFNPCRISHILRMTAQGPLRRDLSTNGTHQAIAFPVSKFSH